MSSGSNAQPVIRTYEEIEKHRKAAMAGEKKRSALDDILLIIFIAAAAVAIYLLVVPWTGLLPSDYPLAEGAAGLAVVFLLAHRLRAYRPHHSLAGTVAYAFTDLLAFLAMMAFAAWTLVFPLLHPLPSETVVVGVVSLVLIAAMVVVLRFVSPSVRRGPDRTYSEIESSIRQLERAVTMLSGRIPQGETKPDPANSDRLSTMMRELEAMRKEFATMRSSAPPPGSPPSTVVYSQGSVRVASDFKSTSGGPVAVVQPSVREPPAPVMGQTPGVPDSTVNNPWLDVLNKRRAKPQPPRAPEGAPQESS